MSIWVVRAGSARHGEYEYIAFDFGMAVVNFGLGGDISAFANQQELRDHLHATAPDLYGYHSIHRAADAAGQLWRFVHAITVGDTILIPRTGAGVVAVGQVVDGGPYHLRIEGTEDRYTLRPVDWAAVDIPRHNFTEGFFALLNDVYTVFEVRSDDASTYVDGVLNDYLEASLG